MKSHFALCVLLLSATLVTLLAQTDCHINSDSTSCQAGGGCGWYDSCIDDCNSEPNYQSCMANPDCRFESDNTIPFNGAGDCFIACSAYSTSTACTSYDSVCRWTGDTCVDVCRFSNQDVSTCQADALCRWDSQGSQCNSAVVTLASDLLTSSTGMAEDSSTGSAIDSSTGTAIDSSTGTVIDSSTGTTIDSSTGTAIDSSTGTASECPSLSDSSACDARPDCHYYRNFCFRLVACGQQTQKNLCGETLDAQHNITADGASPQYYQCQWNGTLCYRECQSVQNPLECAGRLDCIDLGDGFCRDYLYNCTTPSQFAIQEPWCTAGIDSTEVTESDTTVFGCEFTSAGSCRRKCYAYKTSAGCATRGDCLWSSTVGCTYFAPCATAGTSAYRCARTSDSTSVGASLCTWNTTSTSCVEMTAVVAPSSSTGPPSSYAIGDSSTGTAIDSSTGTTIDASTATASDSSTGIPSDPSTGTAIVDSSTGPTIDSSTGTVSGSSTGGVVLLPYCGGQPQRYGVNCLICDCDTSHQRCEAGLTGRGCIPKCPTGQQNLNTTLGPCECIDPTAYGSTCSNTCLLPTNSTDFTCNVGVTGTGLQCVSSLQVLVNGQCECISLSAWGANCTECSCDINQFCDAGRRNNGQCTTFRDKVCQIEMTPGTAGVHTFGSLEGCSPNATRNGTHAWWQSPVVNQTCPETAVWTFNVKLTRSYTISMWLYVNNNDTSIILGSSREGLNRQVVGLFFGRLAVAQTRDGDFTKRFVDPTDVVLHKWTHFVVAYDNSAGSMRLFREGLSVQSRVSGVDFWWDGSDSELQLGGRGAFRYDGLIADLAVYNRSLSPNEIRQLYTNPLF